MADEAEIKAGVEAVAAEVASLTQQTNYLRALQVAAAQPTGSKDAAVRDLAATTVANVIGSIKEMDSGKLIDQLTEDERTALMKYIYRAMSLGLHCTQMLKWHEKLCEKDGPGIVMRTLVDRKING